MKLKAVNIDLQVLKMQLVYELPDIELFRAR